ncbi:hypothetical protein PV327_004248 [Microctonus hyperodae]|uniref:Ig-like domain-containing protein n=1 Tax=Microctonus hyperodae TaxID=165561 RepID=A0AA39FCA1_MICHY|nr:hypothetical protein PV327_004248 [Microctonus hyperodae]
MKLNEDADSYIVPVKKSINIAHDELNLIVNVIPSKEATIQYCRWIRPDGHGFTETNSNQYSRSQTETSCILTLTDWDSTDLGTWSCYVRFSTGSDEEVHTTIELVLTTETRDEREANNVRSVSLLSSMTVTYYIVNVGSVMVDIERDVDKELLPRKTIIGENGSYANVYFKDYSDDITKCYIVNEYHEEIVYILGDDGNGTSAGLELYEKCGVRIPINDKWKGDWKLVRESENYKLRTGIITIKSYPKITSPEESHETWRRQSTDMKIGMNEREKPKYLYCEVEKPDGEVISLRDTKCEYSVGEPRMTFLFETDPLKINATVTTTPDKMINILCQTYVDEIEYCLFTTPNGTMINSLPGNGNEKYMYYGAGSYSMYGTKFAQCGITILQPSNDDYGTWKCTIKKKKSNIINTLVSTAHLAGKKIYHPYVSTKNIYVKRSDNFSITCKTKTSLDYCWLQSPNGTNYSVTKNRGNLQNYLPYVGEGLSVGVCGASIENADDIHSGNWSCRLGVTGGAEIESIVAVTVTGPIASHSRDVSSDVNVANGIVENQRDNKEKCSRELLPPVPSSYYITLHSSYCIV